MMCWDGLAENKTEVRTIRDNKQMVFCAGSSKHIACYVKIIFCVFFFFLIKMPQDRNVKIKSLILAAM